MAATSQPFVVTAHGPRATEAALLGEVSAALEAGRSDPALLAHPLRIVVPSRSLRDHLGAALVRSRGGSVAGVAIQTLHAVALEICERSGGPEPAGGIHLPVLVRQRARVEPELRERLETLVDGYGVVEATVDDLLDAGIDPAHADALEEVLDELERGGRDVRASRAALRVALSIRTSLEPGAAVGHRSLLHRRACAVLERDGARALPARGVLVHGFADATGVATDLLLALQRSHGAGVLLDATEAGAPFTRRFRERVAGGANRREAASAPELRAPHRLAAVVAPGAQAEVREVAARIAALLAAGERAEGIAVVARSVRPYALALRRHFDRLGIPFSGVAAAAPAGALARRVRALLDLLAARGACAADRWQDALVAVGPQGRPLSRTRRADLRLGLRQLGAARLADVARLPPQGDVALPARRGLAAAPARDAEREEAEGADRDDAFVAEVRAHRRRLPGPALAAAVTAAAAAEARLAGWPDPAPGPVHVGRLRELLRDDLGWSALPPGATGEGEVLDALALLEAELPREPPIALEDFELLLRRHLAAWLEDPLGGKGGGVQVLSVMEARARCFEHLYVLGMNRDVFPRSVSEDPLLPDDVRSALLAVLPDLTRKALGYDEERFLFAQLLASSADVTLSWQSADDDGRACAVSTLVERLRWDGRIGEPDVAPPLHARPPAGPAAPRPADEHALLAGLHETRPVFAERLRLACAVRERRLARLPGGPVGAAPLATARLAVLEELDGPPSVARLGPYFGFVGSLREPADPRRGPVYVTRLEGVARCPWRTFVERLLRVEPVPDPLDDLPTIDKLVLGNTVHAVLERVAREASAARADSLDELRQRAAVEPAWPAAPRLDRLLREAAEAALRDEGLARIDLLEVLVRRALPFLERARELDWSPGAPRVLAVEARGELCLGPAAGPALRFVADRVDADGDAWLLTDYKTGRPFSDHKTPAKRREKLEEAIRVGTHLQAAAYARAGGARARGRYLYVGPEWPDDVARVTVEREDRVLAETFDETVAALLSLWSQGAFVPRLADGAGGEPGACARCEVAEACLRGDSGARLRLRAWLDGEAPAPGRAPKSVRAYWARVGDPS